MSDLILPPTAGLGLKPEHFRSALEDRTVGLWFEVHPENYMAAGGPRLNWLEAIRADKPLSFHGVGMSLGGAEPPDSAHLDQLKKLVDRYQPQLVSEHLAWAAHSGIYFNDLLPTPMTAAALDRFCSHIDRVQDVLGRRILVENPSRYLPLDEEMTEAEFLAESTRRTGCGLLVDVNNIFVSAHNLGFDPKAYIDALPVSEIEEIHIAGHEEDDALGGELLIDTHGAPVRGEVWSLYAYLLQQAGPKPTLIERDTNLPDYTALKRERDQAQAMLDALPVPGPHHV